MKDNFDLKKYLKENKSIENLNPIIGKEPISENNMREKIREMIINELECSDDFGLEEAKKKDKEVEDVEIIDNEEETSEEETKETPTIDAEEVTTGLDALEANLEGTESELMGYLMSALKTSKGMGNEKLETQIGNTLKFFVSEYIGGGE